MAYVLLRFAAYSGLILTPGMAGAATIAPPMLDITKQCESGGRRAASVMSECVVAESEARAELLQNWSKYSDDGVEKCWKTMRKAKRQPYGVLSKCLTADVADRAARPSPPPVTAAAPSPGPNPTKTADAKDPPKAGSGTPIFHKLKSFFSSD